MKRTLTVLCLALALLLGGSVAPVYTGDNKGNPPLPCDACAGPMAGHWA